MKNKPLVFAYFYENQTVDYNSFDYSIIDVVNYSFAFVVDGEISITHLQRLDEVLKLKVKYPHLQIVLSIGGWGADGFSDAVVDSVGRNKFVSSIAKVVAEYKLDGVDLDWEYPTYDIAKIKARAEDRVNFTAFIKLLREALPKKIITIAVGAGEKIAQAIEVDKLNEYIDYLHIMTYDMGNFNNKKFSHHTNLYPSQFHNYSASMAVKTYNKLGMPLNKIVIGAAFYGRYGVLTENYKVSKGFSYGRIEQLTKEMNYYFDDEAKAPILHNSDFFVSFDDPTSIAYKCQYIIDNGLAGIMFWQLTSDPNGTLLTAIKDNLKK